MAKNKVEIKKEEAVDRFNYEGRFNTIMDLISTGMALRKAVKVVEMSSAKFFELIEDEEKKKRYARACELRADVIFDEMLEISDTPKLGEVTVVSDSGTSIKTEDMTQHRKLQVETRKWVLAKLAPKKYGDKLDVTSGGDKLPASVPVVNVFNQAPPMASSEDEIKD
jgi:hypothetical protein